MGKYDGQPLPRGIHKYTTADRVRVMDLHYSADPVKDPETEVGFRWYQSQLSGYPGGAAGAKWRQEMEIDFEVLSGDKVFPDWMELESEIACDPFNVPEEWAVYAGYDYGTACNASFIPIAFAADDEMYQIDEISEPGLSVPEQARLIKAKPYWHRVRGIVGDPSIWRRNQSSVGEERLLSVGEMFENEGIYMDRGRNEPGVDMAFVALLQGYLWDRKLDPKFKIFSHCAKTLRCFRNLRKKQHSTAYAIANQDNPEGVVQKNIDEFDALKYILLSRGFEAPEAVECMPGTWGWWADQIEKKSRRERQYLR